MDGAEKVRSSDRRPPLSRFSPRQGFDGAGEQDERHADGQD